MCHIDAKGLQGASIEEISTMQSEREVLFPHKARFRINDVVKSGGLLDIHLFEDPAAMTGDALPIAAGAR